VTRALGEARLTVLDGAGHALMIERAEALNALVQDFAAHGLAG
jgi:pimeloyl-ACP methyl ester carboxylesterase